MVSMTAELPFSSASVIGVAETPCMVAMIIWISGNARPIPSASTSGMPSCAATTNGVVELSPPASIDVVCVGSRPM